MFNTPATGKEQTVFFRMKHDKKDYKTPPCEDKVLQTVLPFPSLQS